MVFFLSRLPQQKSIDYTRQQSANLDDPYLASLADKLQEHYLKKKLAN